MVCAAFAPRHPRGNTFSSLTQRINHERRPIDHVPRSSQSSFSSISLVHQALPFSAGSSFSLLVKFEYHDHESVRIVRFERGSREGKATGLRMKITSGVLSLHDFSIVGRCFLAIRENNSSLCIEDQAVRLVQRFSHAPRGRVFSPRGIHNTPDDTKARSVHASFARRDQSARMSSYPSLDPREFHFLRDRTPRV